jgi:hypothetical protein
MKARVPHGLLTEQRYLPVLRGEDAIEVGVLYLRSLHYTQPDRGREWHRDVALRRPILLRRHTARGDQRAVLQPDEALEAERRAAEPSAVG